MATVRMPDGQEFEIGDDRPELEAYYLGEGATVEKSLETSGQLPRVVNDTDSDGEPAEVEQLPDGEVGHGEGELNLVGGEPLNLDAPTEQN